VNLGKLVRDPALLPALPKKATVIQRADRDARQDFLLRRGRAALKANPSWRGFGPPPDEVAAGGVAPLTAQLKTELTTAATKVTTLATAMADPAKTELVALDDASVDPEKRFKRTYMSLTGLTAEQQRATAIVSAGWRTLAGDLTISDADLHTLVSRRLMMTERMLWYVGRGGSRSWDFAAAHHKEWHDGWNRIFEYPRLPLDRPFTSLCKPAKGTTACDPTGQMTGWEQRYGGQFGHDIQLNPVARPRWTRHDDYTFFFVKTGGADPAQAILDVFTPSKRFDERSFLYCDHVIDCLHLESLVRVKSKRVGKRTWLKDLTDVESDGWLRITNPGRFAAGVAFLVSDRDPRLFETPRIDAGELMVGDHAIVINHPAYDAAKEGVDVWRLENAVVVATSPRLLLQGHGTNPLPFTSTRLIPVKDKRTLEPSMRLNMLGLFNRKLNHLRDAAVKENAKASPRSTIADFDSAGVLVQRTDVGPYSGYDPADFTAAMAKLARWWIRWGQDEAGKNEHTIAADSAWARQTWDKSRVELTSGFGYFPLWLPKVDGKGNPVRKGGKISALKEVVVSQQWAAGWNWYYEKDESPDEAAAHRLLARRPRAG
jgi:hypothetical protein